MTTKDYVLAELINAEDAVSGERLGEQLGVSRAAVNGAIAALREEDYEIESATRRGYRLTDAPDRLGVGEVYAYYVRHFDRLSDRNELLSERNVNDNGVHFDKLPSTGSGRRSDRRENDNSGHFDKLSDRNVQISDRSVRHSEHFDRIHIYEEIDSTNRLLMQMAGEGAPDGTVVIADHQSAGRGRLGRNFASPAGVGVYLSFLIRPEETPHPSTDGEPFPARGRHGLRQGASSWTAITSWTAVAVSDAIEQVTGVRPCIKWVNDLYMLENNNKADVEQKKNNKNGIKETYAGLNSSLVSEDNDIRLYKKICGILTQMDMDAESGEVRSIVIGIGVNVRERKKDFPKEIREIAGSLYTATGKDVMRAHLAAEMVRSLDAMRAAWNTGDARYLEAYRAASLLPGKQVNVLQYGSARPAQVLSVEDNFSLRVRYEDGSTECLTGGEVSIRI